MRRVGKYQFRWFQHLRDSVIVCEISKGVINKQQLSDNIRFICWINNAISLIDLSKQTNNHYHQIVLQGEIAWKWVLLHVK